MVTTARYTVAKKINESATATLAILTSSLDVIVIINYIIVYFIFVFNMALIY